MTPAAVFDLDGTLIRGTSAERLLVPFLFRRGLLGWPQLGRALTVAATLPVVGRTRALRSNKRYLAGVEVGAVVRLMPLFVREVVAKRWCPILLGRMETWRAEGLGLHLLTGAPDFIAEAVSGHLHLDSGVGTPMEVVRGRFTGRLSGPHNFGAQKVLTLQDSVREHRLDLGTSHGFADHVSDVAFLERFGHPVAVSPSRGLRREARRRGWDIISCR